MKKAALIPARMAASRFPGKLLKSLGGRSVISATWQATVDSGLFDTVMVVTDSKEIEEDIKQYGGKVFRSTRSFESGTDRIAEAAVRIDADVIVNVQGDTPFISTGGLESLVEQFEDSSVEVASLMDVITDPQMIQDPNVVKVCVDHKNDSLFFSRSIIPFPRNQEIAIRHYRHIGVYAFRKYALLSFTGWPVTPLETAEKIECLRFLENGMKLRMCLIDQIGVDINTQEDLEKARQYLSDRHL
jgi:3-deoxy-manno-octulosonate cytidylyltransferase (CMP-KDO synthetase)